MKKTKQMSSDHRLKLNDDDLIFETKYDVFSLVVVSSLTIYVLYLLVNKGYWIASFIALLLYYINLALVVRKGSFYKDKIVIHYPLRPWNNRLTIPIANVLGISKGSGAYMDGVLMSIRYTREDGQFCKAILKYPGHANFDKAMKILTSM